VSLPDNIIEALTARKASVWSLLNRSKPIFTAQRDLPHGARIEKVERFPCLDEAHSNSFVATQTLSALVASLYLEDDD
jgi:hypothetical protein